MPQAGNTETLPDAPPILSNVPGSFAWGVFHRRHPALMKQIRDAFPYRLDQDRALDRLGQESSVGVITPLGRHAPDREVWDGWGRDYLGQRWIDAPFLWAESYFYRKLLDVIGFFEPGPWAAIDPFEPFKNAELDDASLGTALAALDRVLSLPENKRASAPVKTGPRAGRRRGPPVVAGPAHRTAHGPRTRFLLRAVVLSPHAG